MIKPKRWNDNDIIFITENYQTMTDKEIGEILGRTECAIASKRKKIGNCTRTNRKYTFDDVKKSFEDKGYLLLSNEEEYNDCLTRLEYICPFHKDMGKQYISFGHLKDGEGCRWCGIEKSSSAKIKEFDIVLHKSLCEKNNFTYVDSIRENGKILIKFVCNNHQELGEQVMVAANMKRDLKGCKYCSGKSIPHWYIISQLKIVNPTVELLEENKRLTDRIKYRCTKHNIVHESTLQSLIKGLACPCCREGVSCGERKLSLLLDNWNIKHTKEYRFADCRDIHTLPFDVAIINEENIPICMIEFDGQQHYEPIRNINKKPTRNHSFAIRQLHDEIKNNYCKEHNIPLIRIPYFEFDNMESFLYTKLQENNII